VFAGAEVFAGPLEQCPWEPGSFDAVTSLAVIEHTFVPREFVDGLARLARPGGLVVIMTGDRTSRWACKGGDEWPLYWPPEHVHFFSGRSLGRVARDCGLDVVRSEWRGMGPYSLQQQRRRHKLLRYLEYTPVLRRPHGNLLYLYCRRADRAADTTTHARAT
jgi:SAM-dependent methyltransferase